MTDNVILFCYNKVKIKYINRKKGEEMKQGVFIKRGFLDKDEEAKLYYLYMMADGDISKSEKKIFNKLYEKLFTLPNSRFTTLSREEYDKEELAEQKKAVMKECKALLKENKDCLTCIGDMVDDMIDDWFEWCTYDEYFGNEAVNKFDFARIIWNLIRLGYIDGDLSEKKKLIVEYLVDILELDSGIYQEFIDTAETIAMLEKHKQWILAADFSYNKKKKKSKEIKSKIKQLINAVEMTISELETIVGF